MTPVIINLAMPVANTEYSVTLPPCNIALLQPRLFGYLRVAYIQGQSGSNFITIPGGASKSIQYGFNGFNRTIYLQSNVSSQVAEIEIWN